MDSSGYECSPRILGVLYQDTDDAGIAGGMCVGTQLYSQGHAALEKGDVWGVREGDGAERPILHGVFVPVQHLQLVVKELDLSLHVSTYNHSKEEEKGRVLMPGCTGVALTLWLKSGQ